MSPAVPVSRVAVQSWKQCRTKYGALRPMRTSSARSLIPQLPADKQFAACACRMPVAVGWRGLPRGHRSQQAGPQGPGQGLAERGPAAGAQRQSAGGAG